MHTGQSGERDHRILVAVRGDAIDSAALRVRAGQWSPAPDGHLLGPNRTIRDATILRQLCGALLVNIHLNVRDKSPQ